MSSSANPDVANLGAFRPPLVYFAAIVIGLGLGFVRPFPFLPGESAGPLGSALVAAALLLFFFSVARFRAADTPVPGNRPTTAIVRTGPYRFSRNPIYLAFSLLQLGIAVGLNNPWLIVTLIVAVALMAVVVIPREERYLERKFGNEYLSYKASVGRWI